MQSTDGTWRKIRRKLRPLRRLARETRYRVLRRFGLLGEEWDKALPEELGFWERALSDPQRHWLMSEYEERMDPNLELQEDLKALIPAAPGSEVRILDVGCGPLSRVGRKWSGRQVKIVAVDPLANEYRALLQRLDIHPPILPEVAHGEKLTETFAPESFDLAYASNSLDHGYDPLAAIRQMFGVVKPGGSVYLWHFAHVGRVEGYAGLHQWDFDRDGDDMTLSNGRGLRHSLRHEFRGQGVVHCERQLFKGEEPVVVARLTKTPAAPRAGTVPA